MVEFIIHPSQPKFRAPQPFLLVKGRESLGSFLSLHVFFLGRVTKGSQKSKDAAKSHLHSIFLPIFSIPAFCLSPSPFSPSHTCSMSLLCTPCSLLSPAASFSHHLPRSHPALPNGRRWISCFLNWGKRRIFPTSVRTTAQLQCISTCCCQAGCCYQSHPAGINGDPNPF